MKTMLRVGTLLGLVASAVTAQNPPAAGTQPPAQPRVQRPAPAGQPGMNRQPANRAMLEQQIRDRIGVALKKNLNLSDDQFTKLQATNKRFEEKRHLLVEQERDARMAMRDLMIGGDTSNQAKISQALDRMLGVQRQRAELMEQEQKELAGYLTPMQRARYLGMQEQMFRRMQQMRAQQPGLRGGAMGPGGRPMGGAMRPGADMMGQGMRPAAGTLRNPQGRPGLGVRRPANVPPPADDLPPA
ncbi:MAG: Spy/CpxP family protein refolding chaperone [Gemmatimonadaceae bacterium]